VLLGAKLAGAPVDEEAAVAVLSGVAGFAGLFGWYAKTSLYHLYVGLFLTYAGM
jgi:hypothetical protein